MFVAGGTGTDRILSQCIVVLVMAAQTPIGQQGLGSEPQGSQIWQEGLSAHSDGCVCVCVSESLPPATAGDSLSKPMKHKQICLHTGGSV